jgi:hypothetical protein
LRQFTLREGQFKEIKIGPNSKDFEKKYLPVQMALKVNELKEVVVKNDINLSMGIIPKGQKTYTQQKENYILQLISMLRLMWAV